MMGFFAFAAQNSRWLGAGMLLTFLSSFGQTFFISIFSEKIRIEFGLSHGGWGSIYALATTFSAVVMIWAGGLADQFKVRWLGMAVVLLLACASLAMAWAPSVWLLALVIFALRLSGQGMCSHIAQVAMARWFVATRGRALAISNLGFSLAEAILPVTFVGLMVVYNWQNLWAVSSIFIFLCAPVLGILLATERSPRSNLESELRAGMDNIHWTRRQAMQNAIFWSVALAVFGVSAFGTAFFFHQVHFVTIKGWTHLSFVAMLPLYTVSTVFFTMLFGWLLDQFGTARLLPFLVVPVIMGFALFSVGQSLWIAGLGFIFFAATAGAMATVVTASWAEFFGTRSIGAIKSLATSVMVFGSALGPGLTGYFIDAGVPITVQFRFVCLFFLLVTGVLWFTVRRAAPRLVAHNAAAL